MPPQEAILALDSLQRKLTSGLDGGQAEDDAEMGLSTLPQFLEEALAPLADAIVQAASSSGGGTHRTASEQRRERSGARSRAFTDGAESDGGSSTASDGRGGLSMADAEHAKDEGSRPGSVAGSPLRPRVVGAVSPAVAASLSLAQHRYSRASRGLYAGPRGSEDGESSQQSGAADRSTKKSMGAPQLVANRDTR